jgi:hypothetical protein
LLFHNITTTSTLENKPCKLVFEGGDSLATPPPSTTVLPTSPPLPPSKTSVRGLFSRVIALCQHHYHHHTLENEPFSRAEAFANITTPTSFTRQNERYDERYCSFWRVFLFATTTTMYNYPRTQAYALVFEGEYIFNVYK